MTMLRKVMAAVGAVVLGAWCLGPQRVVQAGGGLEGRELRPARDLEGGLESLLGELLGGRGHQEPAGRIEGAVVTEDAAGRLTVTVSCSEGLDGRRVRGELLGRDKRVQRQFRPAQSRLEDGGREAALSFEPEGALPEEPALVSAYLRVSVDGSGVARRVFELGKTWGEGSGGGASVGAALVRVKAVPEGPAAMLPAVEPTPVPRATPGPVVRDHRGEPAGGGGVVVRDTPGGTRGRPEVRDHRGETRRPEVRDHRTARLAAPPPAAPVSVAQREAILARTAGAWKALPQTGRVVTFDTGLARLSTADQSRGASGPDVTAAPYDLFADLLPQDIVDTDEIVNIRPEVFADRNPASGNFYFVPQAYHLGWLADQRRYDLAMLYLAATAPGTAGEVSMAAGLTAGIDQSDLRVAEALLAAYCRRHACGAAPQLRPFLVDPAKVAVSFAGTLRLFNIPPEKVAPVGFSGALSDFQLAWVTDPVTKENLQLVLEQNGISGSVTFMPPGVEHADQQVPIQIRLSDAGSFGRAGWQRGQAWRNPSPFPVRVKYLHALLLGPDDQPAVYSWRLGNATVAPGGRMEADAGAVPDWVDRKALRLWVSYAVVEGCASCVQQAMKAITGGVTSVAAAQITFHTINPLAEMGAYEVAVRVRSRRFDPEGRESSEKDVVLKADNQDFTVGPIYAGDADGRGSSGVLFEYFLTVAMADGTEHEARQWIQSRDLRVLIGRSQIEKALGFWPGAGSVAGPAPAPQQ